MTPTQREVQTVLRFLFEKNIINATTHNQLSMQALPYTTPKTIGKALPLLDPRVRKMMQQRRKNRL